jgi:hypothetical protein
MLVAERERIAAPCDVGIRFETFDQRLAPARIAADRVADIGPVGGKQARLTSGATSAIKPVE